jgi:hypothetical protein
MPPPFEFRILEIDAYAQSTSPAGAPGDLVDVMLGVDLNISGKIGMNNIKLNGDGVSDIVLNDITVINVKVGR